MKGNYPTRLLAKNLVKVYMDGKGTLHLFMEENPLRDFKYAESTAESGSPKTESGKV